MNTNNAVIIIGAGGHAKVIIDIINSQNRYSITGAIAQTEQIGKTVSGIPVIGDDSYLCDLPGDGVNNAFIAIGDNNIRKRLASKAKQLGIKLINVISPHSYIAKSAVLAYGIAVMPGAIINADAIILQNSIINTNAVVEHDCIIGPNCHIAPGCALAGGVRVGANTLIGAGSTVIPTVHVGNSVVIGAGSVVISDLPDNVLALGVPARIIKTLC